MPYDAQDIEALLREHPRFVHGLSADGPSLRFREAIPDDAAFILSLRLDPELNRHISPVPDDIERQAAFIEAAAADPGQLYFLIEHAGRPVGTVRLYDQRGTSFAWGSWILRGHPKSAAIESAMMVYQIGLDLGFVAAHFDVRKANEKVCRFHERMGAELVGEDAIDNHYSMGKAAILRALDRYAVPIEIGC